MTTTGSMMEAKSITHVHLLNVIETELGRFAGQDVVRLLDAGCGDGELMVYLISQLSSRHRDVAFEVYGFDVTDHDVQVAGFMDELETQLSERLPEYPWRDRLSSFPKNSPWPYAHGVFDIVVSNQVGEHVEDHRLFFSEMARTLREGGISVNLFPLKHYIYEGHLDIPFVHRISNYDLLRSYIRIMSYLGFGKAKRHREAYGTSIAEFSDNHADYILRLTNYLTQSELYRICKSCGLKVSFKYTANFYLCKLRQLLGRRTVYSYSKRMDVVSSGLSIFLLRYLSSVTVFLEKRDSYEKPQAPESQNPSCSG